MNKGFIAVAGGYLHHAGCKGRPELGFADHVAHQLAMWYSTRMGPTPNRIALEYMWCIQPNGANRHDRRDAS